MSWLPRKCVVVPYDFSELSLEAVELADQLVDAQSHLHAIYVLPALSPAEPGVIWATVDDESRKQHARNAMQDHLKAMPDIQLDIGIGDPGHVIADLAQEIEADLIVIPSHGRSGVQRILLGSVAERVTRMAHCPVLVLRK